MCTAHDSDEDIVYSFSIFHARLSSFAYKFYWFVVIVIEVETRVLWNFCKVLHVLYNSIYNHINILILKADISFVGLLWKT